MKVDTLDHPIASTMVDRGRYVAAALDDADLVERGEKMERPTPALPMRSLVQRRKVSLEAALRGTVVVKNSDVTLPLESKVLSK